jgi:hypothetical protein
MAALRPCQEAGRIACGRLLLALVGAGFAVVYGIFQTNGTFLTVSPLTSWDGGPAIVDFMKNMLIFNAVLATAIPILEVVAENVWCVLP